MHAQPGTTEGERDLVSITVPGGVLAGVLALPQKSRGVVAFASSARDELLARRLTPRVGTLRVDLFGNANADLDVIAQRFLAICTWLANQERTRDLSVGIFGDGIGGTAALLAAADRPDLVDAVVSKSGRPDLAGLGVLIKLRVPTLFIVGGEDPLALDIHRQAMRAMTNEHSLEVVEEAGPSFDEPGTLEDMSRRAALWFRSHLEARGSVARRRAAF